MIICFTLAALNDQDVLSDDVSNAYLNAKPLERWHLEVKVGYLLEPRTVGGTTQIVRKLYGMTSSGNAWRLHLSNILECQLEFKQYFADNDVWMHPSRNKKGDKVYDYIYIYVDDIIICSANPKEHMSALCAYVNLKPGSVGSPKRYLGIDIKKRVDCDNRDEYWILGSNTYLKEALRIVKDVLETSELKIRGKGTQQYSTLTYHPELDIIPFCDPE